MMTRPIFGYYRFGMISLVGLPLLFLLFRNSEIDRGLRTRCIALDLPPVVCGAGSPLKLKFNMQQTVTFRFRSGDEHRQLDSFRLLYNTVVRQHPCERILAQLQFDDRSTYGAVVECFDIIGEGRYAFGTDSMEIYAVDERISETEKGREPYRRPYGQELRNLYADPTGNERLMVWLLFCCWTAMMFWTITQLSPTRTPPSPNAPSKR